MFSSHFVPGVAQSPIDLGGAAEAPLKSLQFEYQAGVQAMFNNGHTIQVQCANNSRLIYDEQHYTLGQFHFHHPSEHTIDGVHMAMELHLVHKDLSSNTLAVVAVMIQAGDDDNARYAPVFDHLPPKVRDLKYANPLPFNPAALLPDDIGHFYAYMGSLTTPPCSEDVHWFILGTPVTLSQRQINAFAALYAHNNRPIQPRNQRLLLHC